MSDISFSKSAIDHIKSVKLKDKKNNKFLRIAVSGGGCSGFQYVFSLDEKTNNDDINLIDGQETLAVTDKTSLPFLKGSNVDYVKELGACYFKVSNPNASNNCGCGSSFSI